MSDFASFGAPSGGEEILFFVGFTRVLRKSTFLTKISVQERSGSENDRKRVPKGRPNRSRNGSKRGPKFDRFLDGFLIDFESPSWTGGSRGGAMRGPRLDSFEFKEFREFEQTFRGLSSHAPTLRVAADCREGLRPPRTPPATRGGTGVPPRTPP